MPITRFRPPRRIRAAALAVAGTLVLLGCADRAHEEPAGGSGDGFPVTVQAPGNGDAVTLHSLPERLVSLSPTVTEVLYAVGAGEQVVAVDEQSDHPEWAPTTGLSGLTPDPEAIAAHDPDLVLVAHEVEGLAGALAEVDIDTLVVPDAESLDGAYDRYRMLGTATGHQEAAERLASEVADAIDELVAGTPDPAEPLSIYHELDPDLYTATSATFVGDVYSRFGLDNIADGDDPEALGGYPQLPAERVLDTDPDLIFLADTVCCGVTAESVAERPGWQALDAVAEGRIVELDDDTASRWGPRIVEFAEAVSDAVREAVRDAGS
ncbi:helical backbone metal receptor [Haloechinothrix sp. LS1_15]|uniref:ABC transporter substrate-binding protein n=1 Tax=Haloechinothrix sp. LS1_15 TaxID=2652248 RepID=UPI00294703F4|nr:helical backbone metal receptor [Haloechinothrix sp. LS1_15]MDV6012671.1 ABC transporter substrate-binding protein [Haloechinothrix sp. LS1_15]